MQIHIKAVCMTNNQVMLSEYRTIIKEVDLRLTGCKDISVRIRQPNLYEILFSREPEIALRLVELEEETGGEDSSGGVGGEGGEGGMGGEGTGGEYTPPSEEPVIINPVPTTIEIFDLCLPTEESIDRMKWCLNQKSPYDITFIDKESTIEVNIEDTKIENYAKSSTFNFGVLFVKNVKDIPEPYVIRMVGPYSDHFSIGEIIKMTTIVNEQVTEIVISIPINYDPSMSFPASTGRNEFQFYIETEDGHHPIGGITFYFQS